MKIPEAVPIRAGWKSWAMVTPSPAIQDHCSPIRNCPANNPAADVLDGRGQSGCLVQHLSAAGVDVECRTSRRQPLGQHSGVSPRRPFLGCASGEPVEAPSGHVRRLRLRYQLIERSHLGIVVTTAIERNGICRAPQLLDADGRRAVDQMEGPASGGFEAAWRGECAGDRVGEVSDFIERALTLWSRPLPPGGAALEAFRAVYTDPVLVNGTPTDLTVLVERARMMQTAFDGLRHTVHAQFEAPGRLAFAFRISGRLVGPLVTPLGELPPTGAEVEVAGMDIFVINENRVTSVWALADYLTLLMEAGAVPRLTPPQAPSR